MPNPQAEALKGQGNQFFKSGQYAQAIAKYKEATSIDSNVPAYWSNMAACFEKLGQRKWACMLENEVYVGMPH